MISGRWYPRQLCQGSLHHPAEAGQLSLSRPKLGHIRAGDIRAGHFQRYLKKSIFSGKSVVARIQIPFTGLGYDDNGNSGIPPALLDWNPSGGLWEFAIGARFEFHVCIHFFDRGKLQTLKCIIKKLSGRHPGYGREAGPAGGTSSPFLQGR